MATTGFKSGTPFIKLLKDAAEAIVGVQTTTVDCE